MCTAPGIYLGGRADLETSRHFWGSLAAVTVYDHALSAESVHCSVLGAGAAALMPRLPSRLLGCTDEGALNFNASVHVDDGSCEYSRACWALT